MAPKITDFVEDAGAPGIIAGIGAVLLAPIVIPVVAGIGKPIAKSIIKGGLVLFEKSKGAVAELGESWEDMVAEDSYQQLIMQVTLWTMRPIMVHNFRFISCSLAEPGNTKEIRNF
jgi:hypothetical protein